MVAGTSSKLSGVFRSCWGAIRKIARLAWWPFRLAGMLLVGIFGRLNWQRPAWLAFVFAGFTTASGWIKRDPRRAAKYGLIILALLIAGGGAWYGYSLIPKPELVTLQASNPPRTQLENDDAKPQPLIVRFSASAAPLDKVGKEVEGLRMSPGIAGRWIWRDDSTLAFEPGVDWPVGQTINVSFDKKLLAASVRLDKYSFDFQTAPFAMNIRSAEFFQDPVDPNLKKAIVEVGFSHPVAPEEFEKRVTLRMQGQSSGVMGIGGETTPFTVSYDKKKLSAFIHSSPLPIPKKDSSLGVKIDAGVLAQSGGRGASNALEQQVAIPGLFSLRIASAGMVLVNNERYEPEQVLTLETSATVREDDMNSRIEAWVLPVYNPETPPSGTPAQRKYPYYWNNVQMIGEQLLKQSDKLVLNPIPAEQENTTNLG